MHASCGAMNSGILYCISRGQSSGESLKEPKAAACARNYLQYVYILSEVELKLKIISAE